MVLLMEGFSIREYAARMRSVDVVKCWPFDDSTTEEDMRATLPPITVKKFSWWLHVLDDSVRSGEQDGDDVDSDDILFTRVAKAPRKSNSKSNVKARVPKKRSIVDIFAVSPLVERVDSDDYDDEDEDEDDDCAVVNSSVEEVSDSKVFEVRKPVLRGKIKINRSTKTKAKKKKAAKKTIVSKLKEVKKATKKDRRVNQRKKENRCLDLLIRKKEKSVKLKVQPPANSFSKPSCSLHSKELRNMTDCSPTFKKKPQIKHPVAEKKTKKLNSSKFSIKPQKTAIPVRSVPKERNKILPVEISTSGILCGPNQAKLCSSQQGHKYVSFSDHASERGEALSLVEEKGINEHILSTIENEVTVQPVSPEQLSVVCSTGDTHGLLRDHIGSKDNSFESYDMFNQVAEGNGSLELFKRGHRVASHGSQYICNPETLYMSQQMYSQQQKNQVAGSLMNACGASERSHDQFKYSPPKVTGVCSMNTVKEYPQHSSAYENVNQRPIFLPETITENCSGHFFQYQPFPQMSPQEFRSTICTFPDWKQREKVCGENGREEDYVGLPLNSQGELINLNSNSKRKLTYIPNSSGMVGPCTGLAVNNTVSGTRGWDKRAQPTDQLKLSFVNDSSEWSPTFPVPSRLGIYEYEDTGRSHFELDLQKGNELGVTPFELDRQSNLSNHRGWQNHQAKQFETSNVQQYGNSDHVFTPSKMRLMGKEFTVGRRDFSVPEDKRIWTDKQIITEPFPADTDYDNFMLKNHEQQQRFTVHPVLGKLKGSVVCSPSVQINQAVPRPRSHFSRQIDSVHQNCLGATKQSPFSLYNQKPNFMEPLTGGYKSLTFSPYVPVPTSVHHYSSQNRASSSVDLNNSRCPMNFPFVHPDFGKNYWSSLSHISSESTPWFSDAEDKKVLMDFRDLYSTTDRNHHYCSISGANRHTDPSVYPASERFCSFTRSSQSAFKNPVAPPTSANYPPMPLQIRPRANACANNRHGNMMKLKEKIISAKCLRDPGHNKRGTKRALSASGSSANAGKIPNLGFREDSGLQSHANFEGQLQRCRQAFDSNSIEGTANSFESGQCGAPEAGLGSLNGEDSFKFDCTLRSGPIKLTAGAKHVLKPCPYNDQINIRPTHSTIPFAAATSDSKTLETEQSTKIYKF